MLLKTILSTLNLDEGSVMLNMDHILFLIFSSPEMAIKYWKEKKKKKVESKVDYNV